MSGFFQLKIDCDDVFGLWNAFIKQFDIDIQTRVAISGTKKFRDVIT